MCAPLFYATVRGDCGQARGRGFSKAEQLTDTVPRRTAHSAILFTFPFHRAIFPLSLPFFPRGHTFTRLWWFGGSWFPAAKKGRCDDGTVMFPTGPRVLALFVTARLDS